MREVILTGQPDFRAFHKPLNPDRINPMGDPSRAPETGGQGSLRPNPDSQLVFGKKEELGRPTLLTREQIQFLEEHHGFAPYKHPLKEFGKRLQEGLGQVEESENNPYMDASDTRKRPVFHHDLPVSQDQALQEVSRTGLYNSCDAEGTRYNVNINGPEAAWLYDLARERLGDGKHFVILPFASEAGTIAPVMRYAMSRVGSDHILAIDAGTDADAYSDALNTQKERGGHLVKQSEILDAVDWDKLKQAGIIPEGFHAKGAKGITFYAGLIAVEALDIPDNHTVMMHDTDITNSGPQGRYGAGDINQYSALEQLVVPEIFPVGPFHSAMIARGGEGRNNEPWQNAANGIADWSENPDMQKLSRVLGTLVWPLTGERSFTGTVTTPDGRKISLIRALSIPVGMGLETHMDMAMAGLDLKTGRRSVMQVANPNPKVENKISPPDREYGLIYGCARYLTYLARHVEATGKQLIDWTVDDIAAFNKKYGGKMDVLAVPNGDQHHNNRFVGRSADIILPSIDQLVQLGAVDLQKVHSLATK